ncbi:hypothetical protein WJ84_01530 [Burkholderia ubonensis]|nr:hypothetical protein WJ84_01530 [Burkholderia ubonensis]
MMAICGCKGVYDCDCVTVENQARRELWTEHNRRLLSGNIVQTHTLIAPSEDDGFFGAVTAHMAIKGVKVQIALASVAVGREPRVNYEVPESVAFQDVPELTRLLSEFATRVAEVNRKANPEPMAAGA